MKHLNQLAMATPILQNYPKRSGFTHQSLQSHTSVLAEGQMSSDELCQATLLVSAVDWLIWDWLG